GAVTYRRRSQVDFPDTVHFAGGAMKLAVKEVVYGLNDNQRRRRGDLEGDVGGRTVGQCAVAVIDGLQRVTSRVEPADLEYRSAGAVERLACDVLAVLVEVHRVGRRAVAWVARADGGG